MRLKNNTPYMIRNDGEVFECGDIHPYILHNVRNRLSENLRILFISYPEWCNWFYTHTQYQETKDKIIESLQYLANFLVSEDPDHLKYKATGLERITYIEDVLNQFGIKPILFNQSIDEALVNSLNRKFESLNNMINQEFLRCRTGGEYNREGTSDIYFRVSSAHFNWFDIIWQLVFENKDIVGFVTIETDKQSGKNIPLKYYVLGGMAVQHMGVDTFITLKGNPVVESYKENKKIKALKDGKHLLEALGDYGDFHNVVSFDAYRDNYYQEYFILDKGKEKMLNEDLTK